jgi:hypothetical protein
MKKFLSLITLLSALIASPSLAENLPAFPGAQGFGTNTPGGRGGRIIKVTNRNNSGSGSFRAAVEASGARIVVFETGGTITLTSSLNIKNPYLTIAGQTAPGDGICIKGRPINIMAHDVVIRGIRYRLGADAGGGENGILLDGGSDEVYNIVIDHCSLSWATDENLSTYRNVHDISISWNIISEGINNYHHGMGLLIGHANGHEGYGANVSVHHNLFAHNEARQPLFQTDNRVEIINNLIYNYDNKAISAEDDSGETVFADIVGNYVKAGLDTGGKKGLWCNTDAGSIYLKGNIGPGRPTDTGDEWNFTDDSNCREADNKSVVSVVRSTQNPIAVQSPTQAYESVLDTAGAISPYRDPVDSRIISDVRNGTGRTINHENDVGGFPNLKTGTAPSDSDNDGIPNSWETSHGLNPNNSADGNGDRNGDGYTNIEEYINGLISQPGSNPGSDPDPSDPPSPPKNLRVL